MREFCPIPCAMLDFTFGWADTANLNRRPDQGYLRMYFRSSVQMVRLPQPFLIILQIEKYESSWHSASCWPFRPKPTVEIWRFLEILSAFETFYNTFFEAQIATYYFEALYFMKELLGKLVAPIQNLSYLEYTILPMIAEIGGFVGLFLGLAVVDLRLLIGRWRRWRMQMDFQSLGNTRRLPNA